MSDFAAVINAAHEDQLLLAADEHRALQVAHVEQEESVVRENFRIGEFEGVERADRSELKEVGGDTRLCSSRRKFAFTAGRSIPPTRYFVLTHDACFGPRRLPIDLRSRCRRPHSPLFATGAQSSTKSLHSWLSTARPFRRSALRSRSTGVSGCSMIRSSDVRIGNAAIAHPLALPPSSRSKKFQLLRKGLRRWRFLRVLRARRNWSGQSERRPYAEAELL